MNGFLIIDKPEGFTSHDVVARCRRILRTKRIGHTGTLDPFATGVMVIMVGRATRLARFLDKDAKEYEAMVRFGSETDTGDRTGELRITNYELRDVSIEEIENILPEFRGKIEQTPPMYSAKKVEGKKLYELARKGIEIERKPVNITIYELEVQSSKFKVQSSDVSIRVLCSAGTYIRTLAEDIGRKLKTGAHLAELRRTRAGKFDLSKVVTLEKLEEIVIDNRLDDALISMNEAISHLPKVVLSESDIKKTQSGIKLKFESVEIEENQPVRMIDEKENLIAVGFYNAAEKFVQPKIVLV
ncbi:MAG: tRNA pseudouridine(55) synthase TruB [Pyrinomonadaceae bacterium]